MCAHLCHFGENFGGGARLNLAVKCSRSKESTILLEMLNMKPLSQRWIVKTFPNTKILTERKSVSP